MLQQFLLKNKFGYIFKLFIFPFIQIYSVKRNKYTKHIMLAKAKKVR